MVGQRYPITLANLAGRGALGGIRGRRWGGSCTDVRFKDGEEEVGKGVRGRHDVVGRQGVVDGGRDGVEKVIYSRLGKGMAIAFRQ